MIMKMTKVLQNVLLTLLLSLALLLSACQPMTVETATPLPATPLPVQEVSPTPTTQPTVSPTPTPMPTISPTPSPLPEDSPTPPPLPDTGLTSSPTPETTSTADPGEGTPDQPAAIRIQDAAFQPSELTIPVGTTVIWTQSSNLPHTVTADDGRFDSGTLQNGDIFQLTFREEGRYPYYCAFHGGPGGIGMSGIIIVGDQSSAASDSPSGSSDTGQADEYYDKDYP
jgi:plastocyanin